MRRFAALLASALVLPLCADAAELLSSEEWPAYGHDYGESRYSPLSQITPANVSQLKPVWTYHMRPPDRVNFVLGPFLPGPGCAVRRANQKPLGRPKRTVWAASSLFGCANRRN